MPNYTDGYDIIDPRTGKVIFSQGGQSSSPQQASPQYSQQNMVFDPQRGAPQAGQAAPVGMGKKQGGLINSLVSGFANNIFGPLQNRANIIKEDPLFFNSLANAMASRDLVNQPWTGKVDPNSISQGLGQRSVNDVTLIKKAAEDYQPTYMTKQDFDTNQKNPLLQGVKDAAGAASMVLPFGSGLKGVLAASALGGFGESDATDVGGLAKDTGLGAAFGAGTYGLVKGAGKLLSKAGEKVAGTGESLTTNRIVGGFDKKNPGAILDQAANQAETVDTLRSFGLTETPQNLGVAQDLLDNQRRQLTDTFTGTFAKKGLINKEATKLAATELNRSPKDMQLLLNNYISKYGDTLTAADLAAIKAENYPYASRLFKVQGMGGNVTPEMKIRSLIHDAADGALKKAIPDINPIYNRMQGIYESAAETNARFTKGKDLPLPFALGKNIPLPLGNFASEAARRAGKGVQALGRGTQALGDAFQGASKLPYSANITGMAGNSLANSFMGNQDQPQGELPLGIDPAQYGYSEDPTVSPFQNFQNQISQQYYGDQQPDQSSGGSGLDRATLANDLLNQGYKVSDIKTLVDIFAPEPDKAKATAAPKITEKQSAFISAGEIGEQALSLLESGQATSGKISSISNKVGRFFDQQSDGQTDYLNKLSSARGAALNALSGAAVSPTEYARLVGMIPTEDDEIKNVKQKWRSFIDAMKTYSRQASNVTTPEMDLAQSFYAGGMQQ